MDPEGRRETTPSPHPGLQRPWLSIAGLLQGCQVGVFLPQGPHKWPNPQASKAPGTGRPPQPHGPTGARALRHTISEESPLVYNNYLSWMPQRPTCQEEGPSQMSSSLLSQTDQPRLGRPRAALSLGKATCLPCLLGQPWLGFLGDSPEGLPLPFFLPTFLLSSSLEH